MNRLTRELVISRAGGRCEYCQLPQQAAPYVSFHVEHIQATQHVNDDSPDNLAFACPDCNRYKGPNLTTLTEDSREVISLFHPRHDRWEEHFQFQNELLIGLTETGRATIRLLQMNNNERLEMRAALMEAGDM
jgi:hypothetical protein